MMDKKMMDKRVDGHTVWGKRWLRVLIDIDTRGLVERAMKQIQTWKVNDLEINNNAIKARVSENARKSYYLQFFMQRWNVDDIDNLVVEILKNPLLAANIKKGEISDDNSLKSITKCLATVGLELFPQSWKELKMYCSCPSWSMPCMHVATVLYLLVFEIDKNPFVLFSLHGVDLRQEVSLRTGPIEENVCDIEPLSNMLKPVIDGKHAVKTAAESRKNNGEIPDLSFIYHTVLPDNPAFCITDNFRRVMESEISKVAKGIQRMLQDPENAHLVLRFHKTRINIKQECRYTVNNNLEPDSKWNFTLLQRLYQATPDELNELEQNALALRQAFVTAMQLIASKAITPRIGKRQEGDFAIVWTPAMMVESVRTIVEELDQCLPPDVVTCRRKHLPLENQAEVLLTLIINNLIVVMSSIHKLDRHRCIFFKKYTISSINTTLAEQIKGWLEHITIGTHHFSPIIMVMDNNQEELESKDFGIDIAVEVDGATCAMSEILGDERHAKIRSNVMLEVSMLMPYINKLDHYISSGAKKPIAYSNSEFLDFLTGVMPLMQQLGLRIMLPNSLRGLARPNIKRIINIQPGGVGHLNLAEMLDIKWNVQIGDMMVETQEFAKIARAPHRLYKYNDRYIYVDENDLQRLREALKGEAAPSSAEILQSALCESYRGEAVQLTDEVRKAIEQLAVEPELEVPRGLKGKLRPYQKRGYEWMYRNSQLGFGSIIADDMGLGKTIQVITLLLKMKQEAQKEKRSRRARFLVIVPTTLITNWQAELDRFAPSLKYTVFHGQNRNISKYKEGILLTTYGVMRSDAETLMEQEWHTVVIDEAQNIKNSHTVQSRVVRRLKAANHIAMSGTPIENRMAEFWSIMDFANHGYLGSAEKFRINYSNPIEQFGDKECAERFRRVTAPFLLRRLKSDSSIINDLPDKIEENTYVTLTDEQADLYSRAANEALAIIEKTNRETPQSLFKRQGLVLQMILTLKQICNHPALFTGKDKSQHKEPSVEQSGKSARLIELVDSIIANGQKALIFTQFREMGDLLVKFISDAIGEEPLFLHGGCSTKERKAMVEEFQNNNERHLFILSIKAGGTGLNLTAASHVIHYDLWWNPAVEAQATDRAYRIGQHQNVIVHRFITKDSFEEQIDRMLEEKKRLADMTVATGESWIAKLSNEELEEIFR